MRETHIDAEEEPDVRTVQRPLLPVLAALIAGAGLALVLERGAAGASPAGWLFWGIALSLMGAWTVSRRARWLAEPSDFLGRFGHAKTQGVLVPALLLLVLLAVQRERDQWPSVNAGHAGLWQTLRVGEHLVGRLEGQVGCYELPLGSVRDGEWIELLATRSPKQVAVGEVPKASGSPLADIQSVRSDEIRRVRAAPQGGWLPGRGLWNGLRDAIGERLLILRDDRARGLARALMLGDRSQLVPGTADLYTRTGTRHALAVSGLHVGLVASLWIWPLGALLAWILRKQSWLPDSCLRWARPEWTRIGLLLLFIPVAGGGAPVLRACIALSLTQVAGLLPGRSGGLWKRNVDALSIWSFAALFEWCADPASLRSISMQLSYTATLGLILLTRPLLMAMRRACPGKGRVPSVWPSGRARSPWLRFLAQRALDWILGALAASVAASLSTLPIVWSTFGEWSLVGPFATLWLLPWLALFLGLGWLLLAVPSDSLAQLLTAINDMMESGLHAFDTLPGTPYVLPLRPLAWLVLAGLSLLLAGGLRGHWRVRARRLSLFTWGLVLLPWTGRAREPELYAADVGHGTAILMRLPGAGTWLFDAGSRDRVGVARNALMPLLRSLDGGALNIALSHGESDHAGALPWLVERYPPQHWLGALPSAIRERLPAGTKHLDTERGRVSLELRVARAPLRLTLLRGLPGQGNEGSRSLEVEVHGERWLLCGDAEGAGLAAQLRSGLLRGPYDLVLFPHHGSETPWLTEFLEATQPAVVWFSCSGRPPVADELDRRGIPWSSTADAGPLRRIGNLQDTEDIRELGPGSAPRLTSLPERP